MTEKKLTIQYVGSKFWLLFWLIIFFPIAMVLLIANSRFSIEGKSHFVRYDGSKFWLCFWMVFFFPIAFILLVLNGLSLISDSITHTGSVTID